MDAVALHDAVAVLEAIVPGSLTTTAMPIAVATDLGPAAGATVPVPDGPPVAVALDADVDAVLDGRPGARDRPGLGEPVLDRVADQRGAVGQAAACAASPARGSPPCAGRARAGWRSAVR
jgi:hypothetical protein